MQYFKIINTDDWILPIKTYCHIDQIRVLYVWFNLKSCHIFRFVTITYFVIICLILNPVWPYFLVKYSNSCGINYLKLDQEWTWNDRYPLNNLICISNSLKPVDLSKFTICKAFIHCISSYEGTIPFELLMWNS